MGYRRNKVIVLAFEGEEYEGLEIRTRSTSIAGILGLLDLVTVFDRKEREFSPEDLRRFNEAFRTLAGCPEGCSESHPSLLEVGLKHFENRIISWNLENEQGNPVPASYEGLMSQDFDFGIEITMAWLEAVVGTPAPLRGNLPDGEQFPEGSIPMEVLSSGQPN